MLDIRLEPGQRPLDPRLPLHRAIRSVLHRYAHGIGSCECSRPTMRIHLSESWRFGGLRIRRIEACCDRLRDEAIRTMPGIDPSVRKRVGEERSG